MNRLLWRLAWRSLAKHRQRNFLTGLALGVCFCGLLLFWGYVAWAGHVLSTGSIYLSHEGHLSVFRAEAPERWSSEPARYRLNAEEQREVLDFFSRDPRVEIFARYLVGSGMAVSGLRFTPFVAIGVEPEIEKRLRSHPEVMRWLSELVAAHGVERLRDGDAAITGPIAKQLAVERLPAAIDLVTRNDGDDLPSSKRVLATTLFSSGLAFEDEAAMILPLHTLAEALATSDLFSIAIYLKDRADLDSVLGQARVRFAGSGLELRSFEDERSSPYYVGIMHFISFLGVFFVVLIGLVSLVAIANAIRMSFFERLREVGTLRALGFAPRAVIGLFLREALALTLCALAGGAALAGIVAGVVDHLLNLRFRPPGLAGDTQFIIVLEPAFCALFALVLGVFVSAGVYLLLLRALRQSAAALLIAGDA